MPTQELALSDPATVGRYRLRGRLGHGGMGVVYLADGPDGRPVAVKCLHPGMSDEVRRRLHREAEVLSVIRHPRVAHFVDADVDAPRPWVAMQYVAGPSLAQAAVPLGPAQLRHLTEGVADALSAMHRQGLVHRDVKPGNVILTHDGPVLVDLGIAAGAGMASLTAVGMVVGTPEWMSPEQLSGRASGAATDIWAWGCISVFAATGRTPFGTGAIEALAHRIRRDRPNLDGVPNWLFGAVVATLEKDPTLRPSAADLADVDGIRRVGAAMRARALATAPTRQPVPAGVPAGPSPVMRGEPRLGAAGPHQTVRPVVPPAAHRPPVRRHEPVRPAQPPARHPEPPTPRARPPKRRSAVNRVVRTIVWLLVLAVLVLVIGVVSYAWIAHALNDVSVHDSLVDAWDWARGLIG